MSLNSWKREFYKGRIKQAAKDPLTAVEHSLQKWKGLKDKHLANHGLVQFCSALHNPDTGKEFCIDNSSCALCRFVELANTTGLADDSGRYTCDPCPIVKATGSKCDGVGSPYSAWLKYKDPQPMIQVLKATRNHLKAQHDKPNQS